MKSTVSIAALAIALGSNALAADKVDKVLNISVYPFAQDEFRRILYDPFEEICGCEIVVQTGSSIGRMANIEEFADNPAIDMAVMSSHDAFSLAQKGLIAELEPSKLTNFDKLYQSAQDPIGGNMAVGYTYYAGSIVYRDDLVTVDSWGDLLSEELAGRVALPDITGTQGLLTVMMLAKAESREAQDYAGVISKIGEKADDVVKFYQSTSESAELLKEETVVAAPAWRFARRFFKDARLKWAEPVEGQSGGMNVMVMTKDNGNEELAYEFMDYWLSTKVQTRLAEMLIDSPANSQVELSAGVAENLTYGSELINSLNIPAPELIEQRTNWVDKWNAAGLAARAELP